jgi:hypothetical protein
MIFGSAALRARFTYSDVTSRPPPEQYQKVIDKHLSKTGYLASTQQQAARNCPALQVSEEETKKVLAPFEVLEPSFWQAVHELSAVNGHCLSSDLLPRYCKPIDPIGEPILRIQLNRLTIVG